MAKGLLPQDRAQKAPDQADSVPSAHGRMEGVEGAGACGGLLLGTTRAMLASFISSHV